MIDDFAWDCCAIISVLRPAAGFLKFFVQTGGKDNYGELSLKEEITLLYDSLVIFDDICIFHDIWCFMMSLWWQQCKGGYNNDVDIIMNVVT